MKSLLKPSLTPAVSRPAASSLRLELMIYTKASIYEQNQHGIYLLDNWEIRKIHTIHLPSVFKMIDKKK